MIEGIDISKWQTITSYDLINNNPNVRFIIHKATQGNTLVDSKYLANMPRFTKPKSAYHYYRPKVAGLSQSEFFHRTATSNGITLQGPPVVDIEGFFTEDIAYYTSTPKSVIWKNILDMLVDVQNRFQKKPLVYTAYYFWRDYIGSGSIIEQTYELMVANYYVTAPAIPPDWTDYRIWQYTEKGTIPGIAGSVDKDKFKGTEEKFLEMFGGTTPPPPPGGQIIVDTIQLDVLASSLNIRNKPNTSGTVTGALYSGDHPCEFEEITNSDGSKWSRIGWKQYACKRTSSGNVYLQYSQGG
jgi:lysozyme